MSSRGRSATRTAHRLRIDIAVNVAPELFEKPPIVAVELVMPEFDAAPRALMVCLPGGGMNRRYFDLPTPSGEAEVSFAAALTAQGFAVALVDPLGVGQSVKPIDAYRLHPDLMAEAQTVVVRQLLEGLRGGTLIDALPAQPTLHSIGIGHSFGALLTILQQAAAPLHAAVALLGFHTTGMTQYLSTEELAVTPAEARSRLHELTRRRFSEPYLTLEPPAKERLVSASGAMEPILTTGSMMVMLPNMICEDAAAIEVPVLLVLGDNDLYGAPHAMPSAYPGSSDVTLLVLRHTRHNHFIYPSRTYLFDRLARWAAAL